MERFYVTFHQTCGVHISNMISLIVFLIHFSHIEAIKFIQTRKLVTEFSKKKKNDEIEKP